jgi:hypothetical protein
MGGQQAYLEAMENLRSVARLVTGDGARATVDRAVGLLAGRTRCRLSEAHRHLLQMAADQDRDVVEVAAGVIAMLDIPERADDRGPPVPVVRTPPAAVGGPRSVEPWLAVVQAVLDLLPGQSALLTPVRDGRGRLTDLVYAATTPAAGAPDGRRGRQLVGARVAERFPELLAGDRTAAFDGVLTTGEPVALGPVACGEHRFTVRVHRLGSGIFTTWVRHGADPVDSDRIAGTERLGNLGWGEWDLVSGEVFWSEQLYRIYERDPALGPLSAGVRGARGRRRTRRCGRRRAEAFERSEPGRRHHPDHDRGPGQAPAHGRRRGPRRRRPTAAGLRHRAGRHRPRGRCPPAGRGGAQLAEQRRTWRRARARGPAAADHPAAPGRPDRAARRQGRGALPAGRAGEPGRRRLVPRGERCATARCCWRSATWPGTAPRRRPRWPSCGTRCAPSR